MDGYYCFGDQVTGRHHEACEDSFEIRKSSDGRSLLFAVADGHGSSACVRSARGSKLAVEVALRWLEGFCTSLYVAEMSGAETMDSSVLSDKFLVPSKSDKRCSWGSILVQAIREGVNEGREEFAQGIVRDWHISVREDLEKHPLGEEEREQVRAKGHRWDEDRPFNLYGTTLIAGVLLPDNSIMLLQQGDGCCAVVYGDGEVACPIPKDQENLANITSSLCDENAAEAMARRLCLVEKSSSDAQPIACIVATDGIEKSVPGEGGVQNFARGVVIDAVHTDNQLGADNALRSVLEYMASQGAGDDATAAGYVNVAAAKRIVSLLEMRCKEFNEDVEFALNSDYLASSDRPARRRQELIRQMEEIDRKENQLEEERRQLGNELDSLDERYGPVFGRRREIEERQEELLRRKQARDDVLDVSPETDVSLSEGQSIFRELMNGSESTESLGDSDATMERTPVRPKSESIEVLPRERALDDGDVLPHSYHASAKRGKRRSKNEVPSNRLWTLVVVVVVAIAAMVLLTVFVIYPHVASFILL